MNVQSALTMARSGIAAVLHWEPQEKSGMTRSRKMLYAASLVSFPVALAFFYGRIVAVVPDFQFCAVFLAFAWFLAASDASFVLFERKLGQITGGIALAAVIASASAYTAWQALTHSSMHWPQLQENYTSIAVAIGVVAFLLISVRSLSEIWLELGNRYPTARALGTVIAAIAGVIAFFAFAPADVAVKVSCLAVALFMLIGTPLVFCGLIEQAQRR